MSFLIVNNSQFFSGENFIYKHFEKEEEKGKITYNVKTSVNSFIEDVFCARFKKGETVECVYMIGCFYIGKTKDLKTRLYNHAKNSINSKHNNLLFQNKFIEMIENGVKCPVSILSYNTKLEAQIINQYSLFYELTNVKDLDNLCD